MKLSARTIALTFATLFALGSLLPALYAQSSSFDFRVSVPFAFELGSKHFAPGTYIIEMGRPDIIILHGPSGHVAIAMTRTEYDHRPAKTGHVVFENYGDRSFLTELWTASSFTHLSVLQSTASKHAAQEMASHRTPDRIEEALLLAPRSPR